MENLYLLKYNNYYNRIVKKENSLSDYLPYQVGVTLERINFNPNDFINTEQIINWNYEEPDYIIVTDENNDITSRWFVVAADRTRAKQLRLELHRDLIVDYYDNIINSECFIEKAIIPSNNNLIFNKENMTFNQIKQSETMLKDQSKCPWICIYAASRTADGASTTYNLQVLSQNIAIARTFASDAEFKENELYTKGMSGINGESYLNSIETNGNYFAGAGDNRFYTYYSYRNPQSNSRGSGPSSSAYTMQLGSNLDTLDYSEYWDRIEYSLKSAYIPEYDEILYNDAMDLNNKIIRVGTDKYTYYRVRVNLVSPEVFVYNPEKLAGALAGIMNEAVNTQTSIEYGWDSKNNQFNGQYFKFNANINKITVSFEDITSSLQAFNIDIGDSRQHLLDAPYDMFCLPYSDDIYINGYKADKALSLSIARELIAKYAGSGQIYDAQILPYCPLTTSTIVEENGTVYLTLSNSDEYTGIYNGSTLVGYLTHATFSSFSRDITLENPIVIDNYKMENETNLYRLCSPNYNGIFEFSAAKNGGVSVIHIQCTYKPFTPYIKLFPDWGRLYGSNFAEGNYDARGLVCGGDFSLPLTTSAWSTYEQQNKNYQLSFARQIENLEVNYAYQKQREGISALAGTFAGAAGGAMAGSPFGPIGMAVGAVGGGLISGLGGLADLKISKELFNEAVDYTKDQFGYQLGNIRAMPQSLSKVTAYNIDNKYFPFIEFYTCSEEEKIALAKKIAYNGMTVMAIGKISDYVNNNWSYNGIESQGYIKGQLIRVEDIDGDYHIVNAIANEINQGVFI